MAAQLLSLPGLYVNVGCYKAEIDPTALPRTGRCMSSLDSPGRAALTAANSTGFTSVAVRPLAAAERSVGPAYSHKPQSLAAGAHQLI